MAANNTTVEMDLSVPGKTQNRGKIIIRAESVASSNDEVEMKVSAKPI